MRAAFEAEEPVRLLLVAEGAGDDEVTGLVVRLRRAGIPVCFESRRAMRRMSGAASSGGSSPELIGLVGPPPDADLAGVMAAPGPVLVLVGLRYPGNVGFVLRSAEVAGVAGVVVSNDWRGGEWDEALRVGMHADRFMPVLRVGAEEAVAAARAAGRRVIAVETNGAATPWSLDWSRPSAVLFGGERDGLPRTLVDAADACVRIPTRGFVPSYNVQAAVGIVLGETLRQVEDG